MLFREDASSGSWLAVAQPAHAGVSGQLAAAWGNDAFGRVDPREEMRLAAAIHDSGWIEWEQSPTFNPATGRPFSFMELPTAHHLRIWSATGRLLLPHGRYVALFASLHGTGLYERLHDYSRDTPEEIRAVKNYLASEKIFQDSLIASLRADPVFAPHATAEAILRNRRLLAAWDALSLLLCFGRGESHVLRDVPTASPSETTTLTLTPDVRPDAQRNRGPGGGARVGVGGGANSRAGSAMTVHPWPSRDPVVTIVFDGRRLSGRFPNAAAMAAALDAAPWESIEIQLRPGEPAQGR